MKGAQKERKKTAKAAGQPILKQARQVSKTMPTRGLQQQMAAIMSPLTRQEEATLEYAHTLANPWIEDPAGVPLVLGSGTVRTNKAQLIFEGQAQANASGFAFVAVCMDGWTGYYANTEENLQTTIQYTTYQGGTPGIPIWYSDSIYAGGSGGGTATQLPNNTDGTSTTGLKGIASKVLDGTVNPATKVRQVAAGLRVFSDAPMQTAQGKLCVAATTDPIAVKVLGGLPLTDYETLSGMPQDLVSFETRPCAGWKSGESLHVVAIPTDPLAFQLNECTTNGELLFQSPQLCAILSGGAPNQTFTFQIVFDYEFTFSMTNITGVANDPVYNAGAGAVGNIVSHMAQTGVARPGPLALTNGKNPLGAKAWLTNIHATNPGRAPQILHMAATPPSGGWLNNLGKALRPAAQAGLSLLSSVPGVGGVLGKLGSGILSMFG